jgi:hypothetical protein
VSVSGEWRATRRVPHSVMIQTCVPNGECSPLIAVIWCSDRACVPRSTPVFNCLESEVIGMVQKLAGADGCMSELIPRDHNCLEVLDEHSLGGVRAASHDAQQCCQAVIAGVECIRMRFPCTTPPGEPRRKVPGAAVVVHDVPFPLGTEAHGLLLLLMVLPPRLPGMCSACWSLLHCIPDW